MNSEKTAVIFNQLDAGISYHIFEGNHSKLHMVYINGDHEQELIDDLLYLMYGSIDGCENHQNEIELLEWREEVLKGALVIECGFY